MVEKKDIIGEISEKEAYIILKKLADEDDNTKGRIEEIALDYKKFARKPTQFSGGMNGEYFH